MDRSRIAQLNRWRAALKDHAKNVSRAASYTQRKQIDWNGHEELNNQADIFLQFSRGKSDLIVFRGQKREGIPLYDALRDVLNRIPKRATTILVSSKNRPWTDSGFESSFLRAKINAGHSANLHFHDLRGTAATRFYIAGLSIRVIAEILAWDEDQVDKIIRRYVDRQAATKAAIAQLNAAALRQK
jgi:integrase